MTRRPRPTWSESDQRFNFFLFQIQEGGRPLFENIIFVIKRQMLMIKTAVYNQSKVWSEVKYEAVI